MKFQACDQAHHEVEKAAGVLAKHGLMYADQRSIDRAGADGDLGAAAFDGGSQFFEFFDRGREVGVGEQGPIAGGFEHAVADGVTLTAIAWIPQQAHAGVASREFGGLGGRAVGGAIVYNQDFHKGEARLVEILDNPVKGGGEALLFVVGGDYD